MGAGPTSRAVHRVVATAGHVDHGKSTLVHGLTGMEPDRLAEEKRRGLTIELGYAWTTLTDPDEVGRDRTVAFVDVPGHERFIATMLAGTGAAPTALLVVAADDGWSRQTTEHRDVLALLEVPALAIAVTKADTVDDDRVDEVCRTIDAEVAGTSLADAPVVVTDAVTGRGMTDLRRAAYRRLARVPTPAGDGRVRLWIDRSFTVPGAGTVVTGTLVGARLHVGDDVEVLPTDPHRPRTRARVRGLQSLGRTVQAAEPGTRVAANLAGIEHDQVARGDVLAGATPWHPTTVADLWVTVAAGRSVARTGAWHLHVGSASTTCRVAPMDGDEVGGREGAVRVRLDHPLPLVTGDRVVLRDVGPRMVAAGAIVVDPAPVARPRGTAARTARARAVGAGVAAALGAATTPPTGDPTGTSPSLPELTGVDARLLGSLRLAGGSRPRAVAYAAVGWPTDRHPPVGIRVVGDHLVLDPEVARWRGAVEQLGPGTHDRRTIAVVAADAGAPDGVAEALADLLVDEGILARVSGGFALAGHVDEADRARQGRADRLVAALLARPFAPPDLDEVVRAQGLDRHEVTALLGSGRLVRCGSVVFAREAVEQAVDALAPIGADGASFTAAEAKTTWGTTRRFAIPLLEHLDRTGVTRFDGQRRQLRR